MPVKICSELFPVKTFPLASPVHPFKSQAYYLVAEPFNTNKNIELKFRGPQTRS
jgi:hypothetical protein